MFKPSAMAAPAPTDNRALPVARTLQERLIYATFTALTVLFLAVYGVQDLLRSPEVADTIRHLGYPWYFSYLLGAGKLLAVVVLLYPKTRILREWAYAGITIELICSFVSHYFLRDLWPMRIAPLLVLAIVAMAYAFDPYRPRRT